MSEETVEQDELTTLKARAKLMGIRHHTSIGVAKLRDKVNAALKPEVYAEAIPETPVEASVMPLKPQKETKVQRAKRLRRECGKLIRIRVACMNPNKKEWGGEVYAVGNSTVGMFKKFVPFNNDEGWHVPNIIYRHMLERKCQIFKTVTGPRGQKLRKGSLIKELVIEVLPPLTLIELQELAQRQAMSGSIDQ